MAVAFSITLYKNVWLIQVERSQGLERDGFLRGGANTAFFMELGIKDELNDGERFTALLILGRYNNVKEKRVQDQENTI